MRKKKNEKKKVILLIITILVILLSLVIFIDDDRKLTSGEKIIKNSVLTISNILSTPFFALKKNLSFNKNYETDISNLESIGINIELLKENEELKKTLELNNTLSERSYINATVINRNISYWFNELTINKGSSDGIKDGMAVINSDGLIGKIKKTSKTVSIHHFAGSWLSPHKKSLVKRIKDIIWKKTGMADLQLKKRIFGDNGKKI